MAEPHKPTIRRTKWKGAIDAFDHAITLIREHPKPALIMLAVFGVFGLIDALTWSLLDGSPVAGGISMLLSFIYSLLFILAVPVYGLSLADGKKISLKRAMRGNPKLYFYVIVTYLLFGLYVAASFIAFIIPVIWVAAWFALAIYPVAEKDVTPAEGLRESRRISSNHKGKVWGVIGVTIVLSIVSGVLYYVPGIGIVLSTVASGATTIVSSVAFALLYRWLQGRHSHVK